MLFLGTSEFLKNIKLNLLVAVLLSVLATALVFVSSVIGYEWNRYKPFSFLENKSGLYYFEIDEYDDECIEDKYYTYNSSVFKANESGTMSTIPVLCIQEWAWKNYQPRLMYGQWLGTSSESGAIPIVVGGVKADTYAVGDVLEFYVDDTTTASFEVVGVLVPKSSMICATMKYAAKDRDYSMYYDVMYDEQVFVVDYNVAVQNNLRVLLGPNRIVTFKDGYESQAEEFSKFVMDKTDTCISQAEWKANCRDLFFRNVRTYIPIIAIGIILILICSYASVYVVQAYSARHMAIYYLVGANQGQRFGICMGNGLGIVGISVLIDAFVFEIIALSDFDTTGIFSFSFQTFLILTVFYLIYIVIIGLVFGGTVKNKSPKDYLRNNM
ncbi:MAG: hypothetical protein K6F92_10105 [Lachnospiraceae bacterium]|nr:hypothetical protein [Lachnospiraceae bacterium]